MELRFDFIKEDFRGNYRRANECAITLALKRMGYPWMRDNGNLLGSKIDKFGNPIRFSNYIVSGHLNEGYKNMSKYVLSSYSDLENFVPKTFIIIFSTEEEENFNEYQPNAEAKELYKQGLIFS